MQDDDTSGSLTKVCIKCGREKPVPEFYLRFDTGRRRGECRECHRAYARDHYTHYRKLGRRAKDDRGAHDAPAPKVTKVCTRCGQEKPSPEFHLDYRTGRRRSACRVCVRAALREHYARKRAQLGLTVRPRKGTDWHDPARSRLAKVCTQCGHEKPFPEFYLDCRTGRRAAQCKACMRAAMRRHYARNREKARQTNAQWRRNNREKVRAAWQRYAAKKKSRQAVRRFSRRLRDLGVVHLSDQCADCGGAATDLHHEDYDNVVDLVSLCHLCHMRRHFAEWRKTGGGPVRYPREYE